MHKKTNPITNHCNEMDASAQALRLPQYVCHMNATAILVTPRSTWRKETQAMGTPRSICASKIEDACVQHILLGWTSIFSRAISGVQQLWNREGIQRAPPSVKGLGEGYSSRSFISWNRICEKWMLGVSLITQISGSNLPFSRTVRSLSPLSVHPTRH